MLRRDEDIERAGWKDWRASHEDQSTSENGANEIGRLSWRGWRVSIAGMPTPAAPFRVLSHACARFGLVTVIAIGAVTGLSACDTESQLLGNGPIECVSVADDGRLVVMRPYRRRTPGKKTIALVDPMSGASVPLLPAPNGETKKRVTDLDFAYGARSHEDVGEDAGEDVGENAGMRVILNSPTTGLGAVTGPFIFRGAVPEVQSLDSHAWIAAPSGGLTRDGRMLLVPAPKSAVSRRVGERVNAVAVLDLDAPKATIEIGPTFSSPPVDATWLGNPLNPREIHVELDDESQLVLRDDDDGIARIDGANVPEAVTRWTPPAARVGGVRARIDRGAPAKAIISDGKIDTAATLRASETLLDIIAWPDAVPLPDGATAPVFIAWSDRAVYRIEGGTTWTITRLPSTFAGYDQ